jgi:hypothetical protein
MTFPITGNEYVVMTRTLIQNKIYVEKYTGKCQGAYIGGIEWLFIDIARVKTPYDVKPLRIFTKWDQYMELSQIKIIINNAIQARQHMEKRALNMILKRLVNEDFQW